MRIAIVTLPLHTNYGGILQAYALQTVLERMGHEVSVLSPPPYKAHSAWIMPIVYAKRVFIKFILRRDISILYDGHSRARQHTDKFIKRHINSLFIRDLSQLKGKFDAYVVGSDQIWRPKYSLSFFGESNAFLEFARTWDVKRIAYAVSFGTDQWDFSEEKDQTCKSLVQLFDKISVRESMAVGMCKDHWGIDAKLVLDPTLLLARDDYRSLTKHSQLNHNEDILMCHILDVNDEKLQTVSRIASIFSLSPQMTNSQSETDVTYSSLSIQPPVEQWLDSISSAKLIVTDSFHACVFSIIFHKPFYVLENEDRGNSRIQSLLLLFGLTDRIIHDNQLDDDYGIDYCDIEKKLLELKQQSLDYLIESLS